MPPTGRGAPRSLTTPSYRFPCFLIASSDTFKRGLIPRYLEPGVKLFSKTVGADSIVHGDGTSTDYETHQYPFATIGPLVSHVFPHFAICNVAQKLLKSEDAHDNFLQSAIDVLTAHTKLDKVAVDELLKKIPRLYASWISVTPDGTATVPDENPSDDEREEPDYAGVGEPLRRPLAWRRSRSLVKPRASPSALAPEDRPGLCRPS
jgi:hypothetical protein